MNAPLIAWFRRDLRLTDQPMLTAAARSGRPVIPLFILDPVTEAIGAASAWRLGLALEEFAGALGTLGSRLILRRGPAEPVLSDIIAETGAGAVMWSRGYTASEIERDSALKSALKAAGIEVTSFPGFLLHEPWTVTTGDGGAFKVYTPFWNAVSRREVAPGHAAPGRLGPPAQWPATEALDGWGLGARMQRGAAVCAAHQGVGEKAALARLDRFLDRAVDRYKIERDFPDMDATSGLSENLTWGEIGPRQIWHAGRRAMLDGAPGAEHFLKELVWREFAWSLTYATPEIANRNWRPDWDDFPWAGDSEAAERWRRGMTGEPFVDAAMRQMYVTGKMHGRARMIAASYLTKHLLTHWKIGLDWFAQCLTDWDPASNAMGWQWVAGSGPDAAPYFRVFNPALQAEKFDPSGTYRRRWIAELSATPGAESRSFFDAVPQSWRLRPDQSYPAPVIGLDAGRARALAAYAQRKA